uniref:Elongation of very long chain fatty acids protein n=1 Tax=Meloidogyne incognita TaxID=6306 RepID=A0A914LYJ1_MELIC
MFNSIERNGIIKTYTQITELQTNQISGFWIFIWVLSKIPELIDTLFLILKGRPIRFMHWFHHSMSILFGTINFIGDNAYLVWVVWMNFFIHSIMYRILGSLTRITFGEL